MGVSPGSSAGLGSAAGSAALGAVTGSAYDADHKLYLEETVLERKVPEADLRQLIDLPPGLDLNEWLASHSKLSVCLSVRLSFVRSFVLWPHADCCYSLRI